jgi:hypothetical protein
MNTQFIIIWNKRTMYLKGLELCFYTNLATKLLKDLDFNNYF